MEAEQYFVSPFCCEWVRRRAAALEGHDFVDVPDEILCDVVGQFLGTPSLHRMFWFGDAVSLDLPSRKVRSLVYFVKPGDLVVDDETIDAEIQFGILKGDALDGLLRMMQGLYAPSFLKNESWPESFKKDFSGQLHKFMASLTETVYHLRGSTVLYVPQEDLEDSERAARDKDLIQRLESALIHWTRQIKEVVNEKDSMDNSESAGPLAEIDFWKSRAADLNGIKNQLERPEVKQIVEVLFKAKSSYLEPFNKLSSLIQRRYAEAQDNLKFLGTIEPPCRELSKALPSEIASCLPNILNRIRLIGSYSQFYGTPDRLCGLLRKVSNEIINRCRAAISLNDIFDGKVISCMKILEECSLCGESWKHIYRKALVVMERSSSKGWNFEESAIFPEVDAFVQRCRDMWEVCEGQIQFCRKSVRCFPDGEDGQMPVFGGSKGPEIQKSLFDIQKAFEKQILTLRSLPYDILDVKATKWHDDYGVYKNGIKDLEVMFQNVISYAFDGITTVAGGVDLLEAFTLLARREFVKRAVEKRTADVFNLFLSNVNTIKREFDLWKKNPPLLPEHPSFSGAALWAKSFIDRISVDKRILDKSWFLTRPREADEADEAYDGLCNALREYINKLYVDWLKTINNEDVSQKLELNLMLRYDSESGMLKNNFDPGIMRMFQEVRYWDKLNGDGFHFEIPYAAMDLAVREDKLRVVREHVSIVVKEYNLILELLSPWERKLFARHVEYVDKRINTGVMKLSWQSKGVVEFFVRECRKVCREVYSIVQQFQESHKKIEDLCKSIAETMLVLIKRKTVYAEGEFEKHQAEHREHVKNQLVVMHKDVLGHLAKCYAFFKGHPEEIQRQWRAYLERIDKKVEDALRTTVKRSLQEISRAINGDSKSEVVPLFLVYVVLGNSAIELRPSVPQLTQTVNIISKELISIITIVPRMQQDMVEALETELSAAAAVDPNSVVKAAEALPAQNTKPKTVEIRSEPKAKYYEVISNDDEILKVMVAIMTGMSTISDSCTKYLFKWEKYKNVWADKDNFIRRFANLNRPLSSFENEINKYRDLKSDIENEETTSVIDFLRVESGPLKNSLVSHCVQWENKFTQLLNTISIKELNTLYEYFSSNSAKVKKMPKDLRQLGESISLVDALQKEEERIHSRFEPLSQQYAVLEKFDVQVSDDELDRLRGLENGFLSFQKTVADSKKMLQSKKEGFKSELLRDLDLFSKGLVSLREEFTTRAPFSSEFAVPDAYAIIEEFRAALSQRQQREAELKSGLKIFEIDNPPYREMAEVSKEVDLLHDIWHLVEEWNTSYDNWKLGAFSGLKIDEMETQAQGYVKRLVRLGRDIKGWTVWTSLKKRVDQFRATMPLIQDLKNPAMRDRHWTQLMDEIGKEFDPKAEAFTLEKVMELGLDQFGEAISSLSTSAAKELSIEQALQKIESTWGELAFDVSPYRKDYFLLKISEDLFTTLEDNQVALGSMKASRFVVAFEQHVNYWERTLSLISEGIDMLLQVQRQWMYLENIFGGSEDIRKQLPNETALFDAVNKNWRFVMDRIRRDPNAKNATHVEGLLDLLNEMNSHLERIQKQLDNYLETKRQAFPRFYFLSNDDLLEILGQARDPRAVQKHLKKCFEAIQSLELKDKDGRGFQALGMQSPDAEFVLFSHPLNIDPGVPVESWLTEVEKSMRVTLKKLLKTTLQSMKGSKKEKWIKDWPGQLLITAGQVFWTTECTKALQSAESGDKKSLRQVRTKWISLLNKYSAMVRGQLSKLDRMKLVALITIEVHARDVIDKMIKTNTSSVMDFEWLKQLRFYWETDEEGCVSRQTNATINYDYEYLGNSGRLVITPLTDRCYMTLTTAIQLKRGGNPQGPAGTGKTETVKDLGKAIAKYVIVFNCSDGLDYKSLGRMFSGLAQTGAWSCFDEFNRIEVEVLSVVAQQILSILNAIKQGKTSFSFEGVDIRLNPTCGIFVTMNPGYAGRSELPDNLKALLRPISMMVPDSALIAEIMLFSEGFNSAKVLSRKMTTLYQLMIQQLSKQDHYDFGLRAVKSVLVFAGSMKRSDPEGDEEALLYRSCRDSNIPKLVAEDVPLFNAILGDLFPGMDPPAVDYGKLQEAIEIEMREAQLQVNKHLVSKSIQLYETKCTRHGVMVVGQTGSGKSSSWTILSKALTRLKKDSVADYQAVKTFILNPKSVAMGELYGEYDLNTREWADGVLSCLMRNACADEKSDEKWLVLDGPVDTLWIESMNTVLDDNKMLTLISGERISLPKTVSLLFEVQDLAVASPATVSRCGMVFYDFKDLGWKPFVDSWLERREEKEKSYGNNASAETVDILRKLFDKYVARSLAFRRKECTELVGTTDISAVKSLCKLYDSLASPDQGLTPGEEGHGQLVHMTFLFCLIWTVGASVNEDGRRKVDMFIRETDPQFPSKETVYEYFLDHKNRAWKHFDEKVPHQWKPKPDTPFHRIMVPTVDTVRNSFVSTALVRAGQFVLLVGNTGVGKTAIVQSILQSLDETYSTLTINFSAQTSSKGLQDIIEARVEKKTKDVYAPPAGRKLVTFIDDLNMPQKDLFGSQPPLELLRHWMDYGFWYDRAKQQAKYIKMMQVIAAMGPPGGGRTSISQRLQSRFNIINVTFPNESQIKRIFGTLINTKLADFEEEIKPLGDVMTQATIDVYNIISEKMLPTPNKSHYLFNMRDLSKVFQGLLRARKDYHDSKEIVTKLWAHECLRVFHDRLNSSEDKSWFADLLNEKLSAMFATKLSSLFKGDLPPLFVNFMREMENAPYEEITSAKQLRKFLEDRLEDYNTEPGVRPMNLVMFTDAMEHVCRIHRVLASPRGNLLLVGVGGSGRQSLCRLASYLAGHAFFVVEVKKNYRKSDFREDLKKLFDMTGSKKKTTVFYFSDTQIVEEGFLEDVNNMLSSGEVPNLYAADEFQAVKEEIRADARKADVPDTNEDLYAFFIERVREHLHIVIGMSPVGDAFRNRIRMFPALVNCTTIDWFSEWPAEALAEVAQKFLDEVDLGSAEIKKAVSHVFVTAHTSVIEMSAKMFSSLKRVNYVTPTNYLELVKVYESLLSEKRKYIGDLANKLRNGLDKLEDTAKQVASMKVELEEKKKIVAKSQKECEDLLVVIVQEKRIVDEQEKEVRADEIKISKEKDEAMSMAAEAQAELDKAIPALEAAQKALESLSKSDVSEVRAYAKPPPDVQTTLSAVMVVLKKQPTWDEAKRVMGDANFLSMLMNYDASNLSDALLSKISKFTSREDFTPELVGKVSRAASGMCLWVHAIENFGRVSKVVGPKRARVQSAMDELARKEKQLSDSRARLAEIMAKVQSLKDQYDKSIKEKETLRKEAEELELKLDRAEKLVNGLSGERARWELSIKDYEADLHNLVGDVLLAAAFLSYGGPFTSEFRERLVRQTWVPMVRQLNIPCSPGFSFSKFLARPTDVRDWNIQGLPTDDFSTENGVLVTRGKRWPLMIDPQNQANKWIKNMERGRKLRVTDPKSGDFLRVLENAIPYGIPVLMQDVEEELDPSLEPLLSRAIVKQGNRMTIRLGDKDVEFNPDFRLYLTTKLANPRYAPEISTKAAIINFAVKEQGLEDQLLGIVVRKERPDLEEQKDELVVSMAAAKRKMVELEDEILRLLSEATGSLLDNEELIMTLQTSKTTSEELKQQLVVAEQTEQKIDTAREQYRPCAARASILFFVLNDLASVDPMYQFALDAYVELFHQSIDRSMKSEDVPARLRALNDFHTYAVYKSTCRGLFEKDKLLFSFQMCVRIMQHAKKINMDEYAFFLRGGQVLDKDIQPPNPCPNWLSETGWDNIYEVDRQLPWAFRGIAQSLEQLPQEWHEWFLSAEPEGTPLPGEWEGRLSDLQRMVLVRCLRPDRVVFMATSFVNTNLGHKFIEPPVADLHQISQETTSPSQPLIFVLSPGVDPTVQLQDLSKKIGIELYTLALGQGQDGPATRLIERGAAEGHWIFLANCHLMISWMTKLEKIIEDLPNRKPHARFRLWLSSSPHPKFPISILQSGIKMTTEPPRGLKNNLLRLYSLISEEDFERCKRPDRYKKLLFALCFFHSVLVERRKFGTLGLNIPYDFNDSDFSVSENILSLYLDEYKEIPWAQLRYLVAEASYGGRVTDDFDRRLLLVYINQYFCDDAVNVDRFRLSSLSTYAIPKDGPLQSFRDSVQQLPVVDKPEAFGQHPNADIASQIQEATNVLTTLLSLQPPTSGSKDVGEKDKKDEKDPAPVAKAASREDVVYDLASDLESRIPENLDYDMTVESKAEDPSALNIVLFQEILRYNSMLKKVRSSLSDLKKGIKGLVVMTAELDEIFTYLYDGRVPPAWLKTYPSLKPLAGWTRDLQMRIQQLKDWSEGSQPKVFWLTGFTFPTGFLTAVMQNAARKLAVSIDTLVWEFSIVQVAEKDITQAPKDGVYVSGVFLEGAGWDHEKMCLAEPKPMQLLVDMPVIHFKPVEARKKSTKGIYSCPLYMYPVRTGTRERPSYIISVDLKSGEQEADHWVKRGTALMLSTA
eukprot:ANDGO_05184.mRNA.1 Dynein-1-beta heavy chain